MSRTVWRRPRIRNCMPQACGRLAVEVQVAPSVELPPAACGEQRREATLDPAVGTVLVHGPTAAVSTSQLDAALMSVPPTEFTAFESRRARPNPDSATGQGGE